MKGSANPLSSQLVPSRLLPLAPFGSSRNPLYACGLGLAWKTTSVTELRSELEKLTSECEVLIPSHFFSLDDKALYLETLSCSGKKIWIQIDAENELPLHFEWIQAHFSKDRIGLQVLCFHPLSGQTEQILDNLLAQEWRLELVYLPYHFSDSVTLPRLLQKYPGRVALAYLPKGHPRDPFFSPLQREFDFRQRPSGLRVFLFAAQESPSPLYRKEILEALFLGVALHQLLRRIYWYPQLLLTPLYRVAAWRYPILAFLRQLLSLLWQFLKKIFYPLRKLYWFSSFQYRKRICKELM